MGQEEHFRKLERTYLRAVCNREYSPALIVAYGTSELTIPVQERFLLPGGVHGSVYFKALDDAAYFAVNSLVEDMAVVTVSFTIHFMRRVTEGHLKAKGHVAHASERLFFAEATLVGSRDQLLATGTGLFAKSGIPLSPSMGYE